MIVLSLTSCPQALRGDLTRWLFEVDTNLYVGKQSARVREMIWERVVAYTKSGRAVMVYPTNNEQGFDFRVWGATWEPTDYDGLKLMLRPHAGIAQAQVNPLLPGASKVEKRIAAKRYASSRRSIPTLPDAYLVVDVETTGLSADKDEMIEIGAIKVIRGDTAEEFQALIRTKSMIPLHIETLTGITNEDVAREGRDLQEIIRNFREFAADLPIVSHNVSFDMSFLRKAYGDYGYPMPKNTCIDTLRMARQFVDDSPDYKLGTLLKHFGFEPASPHRGLGDCEATKLLYEKLRLLTNNEVDAKVNEND